MAPTTDSFKAPTVADASKDAPTNRSGRRAVGRTLREQATRIGVALGTIRRWAMKGVVVYTPTSDGSPPERRRIQLEHVRFPGFILVTDEAMDRFFAAMNQSRPPVNHSELAAPGQPESLAARADAALDVMGW